jgi:hypothetical protein
VLVRQCVTDSASHSGPQQVPCYNKTSLWGNVFCRNYKVGAASYHFRQLPSDDPTITTGEAYASYEHDSVAGLEPLDNGRPVPSRVTFRNVACPDPYTFRASLCWLQDYNTTWQGASRWDFEMKFDTAYMCILSGTVNKIITHDDGQETSDEMLSYGARLMYINAGLFDEFLKDFANAGGDTARSDDLFSLHSVTDRLREEDVPKKIISAIRFLRVAAYVASSGDNEDENPMDLQYFNP